MPNSWSQKSINDPKSKCSLLGYFSSIVLQHKSSKGGRSVSEKIWPVISVTRKKSSRSEKLSISLFSEMLLFLWMESLSLLLLERQPSNTFLYRQCQCFCFSSTFFLILNGNWKWGFHPTSFFLFPGTPFSDFFLTSSFNRYFLCVNPYFRLWYLKLKYVYQMARRIQSNYNHIQSEIEWARNRCWGHLASSLHLRKKTYSLLKVEGSFVWEHVWGEGEDEGGFTS